MKSKNMNYCFNVEYFEDIDLLNKGDDTSNRLKKRNREIVEFKFGDMTLFKNWQGVSNACFSLYTSYPGVMLGIGNPHNISKDDAVKCGFSFDYVTGVPYAPGSSLKGVLRSFFPEIGFNDDINEEKKKLIELLISDICGEESAHKIDVNELRDSIFENNDVFLGAVPKELGAPIMEMEYITPHKEPLKNPTPIKFMKIKPNVELAFFFKLNDYKMEDTVLVSAEQKKDLFRQILLLSGIGAKTNVGFGALVEYPMEEVKVPEFVKRSCCEENGKTKQDEHLCKTCGKPTDKKNDKSGEYNTYCKECRIKYYEQKKKKERTSSNPK